MRALVLLAAILVALGARAEGLREANLGIVFNLDDAGSRRVAQMYADRHHVPRENLVGLHMPVVPILAPAAFAPLRRELLDRLPTHVQALLLVWSRPWAIGCMSVTTAVAAGFHQAACNPGCVTTPLNPLFDTNGWLPADTIGWFPAMLLPSDDEALARDLVDRALESLHPKERGTLYLVRTDDGVRNVRAEFYGMAETAVHGRLRVQQIPTPARRIDGAVGYFTGSAHVSELDQVHFVPGALADHLTSSGGMLEGGDQTTVLAWLRQGATASYGSVSEPCNFTAKFPDVRVLFEHYLNGETALESYWKSVQMIDQGLVVGDPLARPFPRHAP